MAIPGHTRATIVTDGYQIIMNQRRDSTCLLVYHQCFRRSYEAEEDEGEEDEGEEDEGEEEESARGSVLGRRQACKVEPCDGVPRSSYERLGRV